MVDLTEMGDLFPIGIARLEPFFKQRKDEAGEQNGAIKRRIRGFMERGVDLLQVRIQILSLRGIEVFSQKRGEEMEHPMLCHEAKKTLR